MQAPWLTESTPFILAIWGQSYFLVSLVSCIPLNSSGINVAGWGRGQGGGEVVVVAISAGPQFWEPFERPHLHLEGRNHWWLWYLLLINMAGDIFISKKPEQRLWTMLSSLLSSDSARCFPCGPVRRDIPLLLEIVSDDLFFQRQLSQTSLVVQWIRIRLPVQGTQIRSLDFGKFHVPWGS